MGVFFGNENLLSSGLLGIKPAGFGLVRIKTSRNSAAWELTQLSSGPLGTKKTPGILFFLGITPHPSWNSPTSAVSQRTPRGFFQGFSKGFMSGVFFFSEGFFGKTGWERVEFFGFFSPPTEDGICGIPGRNHPALLQPLRPLRPPEPDLAPAQPPVPHREGHQRQPDLQDEVRPPPPLPFPDFPGKTAPNPISVG